MSAKRRLLMVGFGLSEPGTMGGNTKIALEVARHLCSGREVHLRASGRRASGLLLLSQIRTETQPAAPQGEPDQGRPPKIQSGAEESAGLLPE